MTGDSCPVAATAAVLRSYRSIIAVIGLRAAQHAMYGRGIGNTPGGEANVAKQSRAKPSYRRASRPSKLYQAEALPQQPRRGGFFRRLFGGRE
jgi:hypothetical protein